MVNLAYKPFLVPYTQHQRFTKENEWQLWDLDLSSSGDVAVSGGSKKIKRTFIDLYSDSGNRPTLYYSKEFPQYSEYWRKVSFLQDSGKIVTCIDDKVEIIETNSDKILQSRRVNGWTRCLAVREKKIFVSLYQSKKVTVYDRNLNEVRTIILEGIEDGDFPYDMALDAENLYVRTYRNRAFLFGEGGGNFVTEFKDIRQRQARALSITVDVTLGIVAVLWDWNRVHLYRFKESKSFLIISLDCTVFRVRLSGRGRLVIGNRDNGEIQTCYLEPLFTFEAIKTTVPDSTTLATTAQITERTEKAIEMWNDGSHQVIDDPKETTRVKAEDKVINGQTETFAAKKIPLGQQEETLSVQKFQSLQMELEKTKRVLEETVQDRNKKRTELKQCKLEFAKESKALEEVTNQMKLVMTELKKATSPNTLMNAPTSVGSQQTRITELSSLAAEFGRLIVEIGESLTLDHSLKLSKLLGLSATKCDTLRRVSFYKSPGIKLLELAKQQNIINIYDITNLQKALASLQLDAINSQLVIPYQKKIDVQQYEFYKTVEIFTWDDVKAILNAKSKKPDVPHEKHIVRSSDDDTINDFTAYHQNTDKKSKVLCSGNRYYCHAYIEHCIGKEGGTVQLADVSINIPPGAFVEDHVIALSIIHDPPFPLPRDVDDARMTPLVKLEPLGLVSSKPLQLTIPHSALIPEPEKHKVVVYSGQGSESYDRVSGCITWTEEKSLPRKLKEKSLTVDIQCLRYFSASLENESKAPLTHVFRVVAFVDEIRHTNDDIILTLCICRDDDADYNMLLTDYNTKLALEQYTTLHLRQHPKTYDTEPYLAFTVSSMNSTYETYTKAEVKGIFVSHVCSASRVTLQFRLKRKPDTEDDAVDVRMTISQDEEIQTEIFFKTRVKDLIVLEGREDIFTVSLPQVFKPYEDLKEAMASLLDATHCLKLATYFGLSPAEIEVVTNDSVPGRVLMKILDEREKIMPRKMMHLFTGLKFCHLDKIARIVSEYISKNSEVKVDVQQNLKEKDHTEDRNTTSVRLPESLENQNSPERPSCTNQSVQTNISSSCVSSRAHIAQLTREGYAEHDAMNALDISGNSLIMSRKLLHWIKDQNEVTSSRDNLFLMKEQYIDQSGGEIALSDANVVMVIPAGALSKGRIVNIKMIPSTYFRMPLAGRTPRIAPVIKCGQEGLELDKPLTLRIPHCITDTGGIMAVNVYYGFLSKERHEIEWQKSKKQQSRPIITKDHFDVLMPKFCVVSVNVTLDFKKHFGKRLRILPLIKKIAHPSDDLVITVWLYNDDEAEHLHLLHEEIAADEQIQVHEFKRFTLESFERHKDVSVKCENEQVFPYTNESSKRIISEKLWYYSRQKLVFCFSNKDCISDINFKIRLHRKQWLLNADYLQLDFKTTLSELQQNTLETPSASCQSPNPQSAMESSFNELRQELLEKLGPESCLEIAEMFGLDTTVKDKIRFSSDPEDILLDCLLHNRLISASNLSPLDFAFTKSGHEHLATVVRQYRRNNNSFSTTTFSLME